MTVSIRSAAQFAPLYLICATASTSHAQNITEISNWRSSEWMNALVVSNDWVVVGASKDDSSIHFINRQFYLSDTGNPVVFVRVEEKSPQSFGYLKYLSFRMAVEVDCLHHKSRELEETIFSGRNLDGLLHVVHVTGEAGEWSYPAPNTMGDAQFQRACALATGSR